jgi:hypothetical protein
VQQVAIVFVHRDSRYLAELLEEFHPLVRIACISIGVGDSEGVVLQGLHTHVYALHQLLLRPVVHCDDEARH